jgi:DNA-binding NarL/FixJ family response regulator
MPGPPGARIRILLVDDHAMVRRGMRDFLSLHDDLEVVGNRAIADELGITERTARTHVSNVLAKLGLASRTQAALFAVQHGLDRPT